MRNIFKRSVIICECLLCACALLFVVPGLKVQGLEISEELNVVEETTEKLDTFDENEEISKICNNPALNEELSAFIDTYSGNDGTDPSEEVDNIYIEQLIFNKEDDITCVPNKDDWRLILVNKQNFIPEDYDPNLVNISGSMMVDERIVGELADMLKAAREDGISLMPVSAYRSYDRQTTLFNNKVHKFLGQGMSYMDAYAKASTSVTVPGCSEHQLGLALDIVTGSHTALDQSFGDTAAGQWLKNNCYKYGFILRYPQGKENITGIIYEPWHFRYVGIENATEIMNNGLTLEEYVSR